MPVGEGTVNGSTPGGWADVYRGTERLGRTPVQLRLAAGPQRLTLRPFGGAAVERRVDVSRAGHAARDASRVAGRRSSVIPWRFAATAHTSMDERTKQSGPSGGAPSPARLCLLVRGRGQAHMVPLAKGARLVLGRSAPADVVVDDETLSRRHAAFTWTDEGVWVEDLGSLNGTKLGERAVTRSLLVPGSEVTLGQVVVSVHEDAPRADGLPIVEEEGFDAWLEEAVDEARERREPLALLMIRSSDLAREPMHAFVAAVRGQLSGWDHLGVYGPGWLIAAKRALGFAGAEQLASALAARAGGAVPFVGVAVFPDSATTADALIAEARAQARAANARQRVMTARLARQRDDGDVLATSAAMRSVIDAAIKAARSRAPILLLGETGTGKDVLARAIVAASTRAQQTLKIVNCAAIPSSLIESTMFGVVRGAFTGADRTTAGVFEEANGGTVFLDEIGELPASAQAALLRVLETGKVARVGASNELAVDVRLVAATNRDLEALAASGAFRSDLLYRINTVTLRVPPLRDRREDVVPLAQQFLDRAAAVEGRPPPRLAPDLVAILEKYQWPGNVRELRNVIERMAILADGDVLGADDLPTVVRLGGSVTSPAASTSSVSDLREHLREVESALILSTLRACGWNQTEAARRLSLPIRTLTHKIAMLGLKARFPKA